MESKSYLHYSTPQSSFEPSFWEQLYQLKLNIYRLNAEPISIQSLHLPSDGKIPGQDKFTKLSYSSNNDVLLTSRNGQLLNMNTIEEFINLDKKKILNDLGSQIVTNILTGKVIEDPSLLFPFLLISFADLKYYKFVFWFGSPVITPFQPIEGKSTLLSTYSYLKPTGDNDLLNQVYTFILQLIVSNTTIPPILVISHDIEEDIYTVLTLQQAWSIRYQTTLYYLMLDQSFNPTSVGWNLRNLLALLSIYSVVPQDCSSVDSLPLFPSVDQEFQSVVKIIGLRNNLLKKLLASNTSIAQSISVEELVNQDASVIHECHIKPSLYWNFSNPPSTLDEFQSNLTIVGWEPNERGKAGPRQADLSSTMDSKSLMTQAVDLNLRLMKWRMWTNLDLERLATTKCLLLGAGTLGCAVARCLIGWGIRNITFVDNGKVSYSNPVRQSLFEYEDCINHSYKAKAAAMRLKKIFPEIQAEGVLLTIPMPGHPFNESSNDSVEGEYCLQNEEARKKLEELILSHDVCFALTDSREARWLPTAICGSYNKLLINAALGFDSYLVMRHGRQINPDPNNLDNNMTKGCYYCNDIVAATNSRKDRPLDEQCTVTRPGLSSISAGWAVELMVALLQEESLQKTNEDSPIPHQLRGSVLGFNQISLETPAFSMCTACSPAIQQAYLEDPSAMMKNVASNASLLEEISGVHRLTNDVDLDLCIESDDEF